MSSELKEFGIAEIALNPFLMHLTDSILATHMAKTLREENAEVRAAIEATLSRTAIAHAVFAMESMANSLLAKVPRPSRFRDQAERWTVFDKIDLFLLTRAGAPVLPRDHKRVSAIQQLISFRDHHVHPRSKRYGVDVSQGEKLTTSIAVDPKHVLNIPSMAMAWRPEHAVLAINAVLDFARLIISLASMTKSDIHGAFQSLAISKDGERIFGTKSFRAILSTAGAMGMDVSFIN